MLPMSPRRSDASARPSTAAGAAPPPLGSSTMMSTIPLVDTITPRPEPLQPTPHPEQGARRRTLTNNPPHAADTRHERGLVCLASRAVRLVRELVLQHA